MFRAKSRSEEVRVWFAHLVDFHFLRSRKLAWVPSCKEAETYHLESVQLFLDLLS